MAKCVINVLAVTILTAFAFGTVVHAQEPAPVAPELAPSSGMSPPAPIEPDKKMEGEKERKGNKSKKAGRGKKKGKKHGRSSG